jgi:hypothetical protein
MVDDEHADYYHELQADREVEDWMASVDAKGPQPCERCGKPTMRWYGSSWRDANGKQESIHYNCGVCLDDMPLVSSCRSASQIFQDER